MIISTNKTSYPDTLIVILDQDKGRSKFTEKIKLQELKMRMEKLLDLISLT